MDREFFRRRADVVARELLGCEIIRVIDGKELRGRIVECEAYFDEKDPASRARQNGDLRETMRMDGGTILVYGVHNNWMVNFVSDKKGVASAVLIRAVEPLNFEGNCRGPGRLTRTLKIDKRFHKGNVGGEIRLRIIKKRPLIERSFRIGVKKDLKMKMRFCIKGNVWARR